MESRKEKNHYCVLYTSAVKQAKLEEAIKKTLPEGKGIVFYPCMECWRRDSGKCEVKALFPGYIFIRSDMDALEIHEYVKEYRGKLGAFIRELGLSEKYASGNGIFGGCGSEEDRDGEKEDGYRLTDLTEEEAEFMDFLLDSDDTDSGISGGVDDEDDKNGVPAEGLLKMSYGYQEGSKYKVMKGPLRAYEGHIAGVNKHDKKAYLDFKINGKVVRAGFDVMPKRYWFPEDKDTPEVLTDGTEVDLQALAKAMMG